MRAILRGTINRITGEVVEYNYRVYATGKSFGSRSSSKTSIFNAK